MKLNPQQLAALSALMTNESENVTDVHLQALEVALKWPMGECDSLH
jgi:hypothetical protein